MSHYSIGCDAHKRYPVFAVLDADGVLIRRQHVNHEQGRHVSILYERIRRRKGHAVAVGAVARHKTS